MSTAAVTPIVVSVSRPGNADVHAAVVPVVVDNINAGKMAGSVAEPVVFAAGKAQGPNGQDHD